MRLGYLAIDQYGNRVIIEKHPRKELMEWANTQHAEKMFIDSKSGETNHIGYTVKMSGIEHWF